MNFPISPLIFFVLNFLATTPARAEFRSGFYALRNTQDSKNSGSANNPLGPVVFIHREEVMVHDSQSRTTSFKTAWRGVFGKSGTIESQFNPDGSEKSIRWNAWKSGTIKFGENKNSQWIEVYDSRARLMAMLTAQHLGVAERNLTKIFPAFKPVTTQYLAHRGTALVATNPEGTFPANTFPAFEAALQAGYPGVELDVHVSKDGQFIVSHDADLSISTNCKGMIADLNASEITPCLVTRSGLVPETSFASRRAKAYGYVPTLRHVFSAYLPYSRMKTIVIDIKPGNAETQSRAMERAMEGYAAFADKIIFLQRDNDLVAKMKSNAGWDQARYALEGETGWEPLNDPERAQFLKEGISTADGAKMHDSISLSVGLGLGLNGWGRDIPSSIGALGRALGSIPNLLFHWNIDIAHMQWSPTNFKKYRSLLSETKARKMKMVAWTVNTARKLKLLREKTPDVDFVLSDLPYGEIARIQLQEAMLSTSKTNSAVVQ